MTANIITSSNSISGQLVNDSAGAVLVITEGGYIVNSVDTNPAFSAGGGGVVIDIRGSLISSATYGMDLRAIPSTSAPGHGSINVGITGLVESLYTAIVLDGDRNKIVNAGTIRQLDTSTTTTSPADASAIYANATATNINNSGQIIGHYGIYATGSATIINSGEITSTDSNADAVSLVGNSTITNTGAIHGAISLGNGTLTLTNNGLVDGNVTVDGNALIGNFGSINGNCVIFDGSANINNYGSIEKQLNTGIFEDTIGNYGKISGLSTGSGMDNVFNATGATITFGVDLGTSDDSTDVLVNQGTIGLDLSLFDSNTITFGDGADFLTNSGTIYGRVDLGSGNDVDTVTNSGHIYGSILAGDGNDVIDNSLGTIDGVVDLGVGIDTYTGGDGADRVIGGASNDAIDLGAGTDVYRAGNNDGKDDVDGGAGIDTYNASATTQGTTVDLGAGTTAGTVGNDTISGFENIVGGSAGDTLTGDDGVNRIDGGMGADKIDGDVGNDRLIGGTGTDTITGGIGRDVLTGGLNTGSVDSDTFVFQVGDSGTTAATRDRITDFTDHGSNAGPFATGADLINLSGIDANINLAGDQAFSFNQAKGAAFSGTAGSLIWQQYGAFALISGDTNGDKIADFTIQLNGTHTLFASDFVL